MSDLEYRIGKFTVTNELEETRPDVIALILEGVEVISKDPAPNGLGITYRVRCEHFDDLKNSEPVPFYHGKYSEKITKEGVVKSAQIIWERIE